MTITPCDPFVPNDVLFLLDNQNTPVWIAANIRAKTFLGLSFEAMNILSDPHKNADQPVLVWDIQYFAHTEGLLADPTRFVRDRSKWPEPVSVSRQQLTDKLLKQCILIHDEDEYRKRFSEKTSLLDWHHFGTFHQQLGQHLIAEKRVSPEAWWMDQKFTADRKSLKDNLYQSVQGRYLDEYFKNVIKDGMNVVDIGCGTGFYSKKMAEQGATVLGVDPSERFLSEARTNSVLNAAFQLGTPGISNGLAAVPSSSADLIFMSDALLYYFHKIDPREKPSIQELLTDAKRILKPTGVFVSVEPHSVFFQQPWLGSQDMPWTVISEYSHKKYGIVPTIGELIGAFCSNGFLIRNFKEIYPEADLVTDRANHFAYEFPIWHLLEATPNQQ